MPIKPLCLVCLLVLSSPGFGQIYEWIDDTGRKRFSDKPPPGQIGVPSEESTSSSKYQSNANGRPLTALAGSRRSILEVIRYQIQDDQLDSKIGKRYRSLQQASSAFLGCDLGDDSPLDTSFALSALRQGKVSSIRVFHRLLREFEYPVAEASEAVFANQKSSAPELSIAALIKEAHFEHCAARGSNSSYNKTDLTIEWQVFDNLKRNVVFTSTISGKDDKFAMEAVPSGAASSFEAALLASARKLLSDEGFRKAVVAADEGRQESTVDMTRVSATYGDQSQKFVDRSALIEQGSVTVRTATGHGSGFFVTREGHLLTNHHVIDGSTRVLLLLGDEEISAQVVQVDAERDVALLVAEGFTSSPLTISGNDIRVGEQIYVVGTPLSEELSFTVTRGIVSGLRNFNGLPMLQTDAAVNPGNSGGPVLDEFGNVVAISVSGVFSRSGGSLNTNFLIPIEDALSRIGIRVD